MPNPSHVIGTPDGDLYAYDWTSGEWVSLPESGGSAGLVLEDSGGQGWQVTAADDGALVTTATTDPGADQVQVGPYMLSVDTDGVLITTES